MVLRIIFGLCLILSFGHSEAQIKGKIVYTDSYGVNFFNTTENLQETRMYFGSDLFRLLDEEQLSQCAIFLKDYLAHYCDGVEDQFRMDQSNVLSTSIQCSDKHFYSLSYYWTKNYLQQWQEMVSEFDIVEKPSSHKNVTSAFMRQAYFVEKNNLYSTKNTVLKIKLLVSIPNGTKTPEEEITPIANKLKDVKSSITFNETVVIENSEPLYAFFGPSSSHPMTDFISLLIASQLLNEKGIENQIDFGIGQTTWAINMPPADFNTFDVRDHVQLDSTQLYNKKQAYLEYFERSKMGLGVLYFYENAGFKLWDESVKRLNITQYTNYFEKLVTTPHMLTIPMDSFAINDSTFINATDNEVLRDTIYYKPNSTTFRTKKDSNTLYRLEEFLVINPQIGLSINGVVSESEYIRVDRDQKYSLMESYKKSDEKFTMSRRVQLGLVRTLEIYDYLQMVHPNPGLLRCYGEKRETKDKGKVYFHVYNIN